MLDGLAAAHAAGVLHRDVKPSNVLLDADDRAVLTDFGIAQSSGDASLTRTGLLVGSPAYLSPERARGEPATEASDLWALGATLFAAASGHSPFDRGEALPTLAAVVGDPVRPPLSAGALRPALEGLLRKDPARRFDTGQARAALETAAASGEETPTPVQGVPVPGTEDLGRTVVVPPVRDPVVASPSVGPVPPPRAPRPRRPFSGGRLLAVLAAVVLVLLVAGLLHSLGSGGDPSAGGPSTTPSTNRPSGSASSTPSRSASSTPSRSSSVPATTAANVPAGYHLHRDPTGFTVAVPDGWSQRRDGSRVDFVEPGGRRFLRIDQTDSPKADPVKDWQQQEKSVRQRLPGYHRISIEAVDYRDYKTADWEFTFGSGSGRTHVLDRGLTTGERGYAIYWSTPDSAWSASSDMLRVFEASFQPAS